MIRTDILAVRGNSTYSIPFQIGNRLFPMKFDTGAAYTVISIDLFSDRLAESERNKVKEFFQKSHVNERVFTSASGDEFTGYQIHAQDVIIDDEAISDFFYYLIVDNKRMIALLGTDFIDYCDFRHLPCGDIKITGIEHSAYHTDNRYVELDELVSFIDSIEYPISI